MKLTTLTHVSVDGVMQGLGGPAEDRRGGFEATVRNVRWRRAFAEPSETQR